MVWRRGFGLAQGCDSGGGCHARRPGTRCRALRLRDEDGLPRPPRRPTYPTAAIPRCDSASRVLHRASIARPPRIRRCRHVSRSPMTCRYVSPRIRAHTCQGEGRGFESRLPLHCAVVGSNGEPYVHELASWSQVRRPVKAARRSIGVAEGAASVAAAKVSPPRIGSSASLAKASTLATRVGGGS